MINKLILLLIFAFGNFVYAQQNDCKVIKAEISGTYKGGCKNGLAQGKGIAQGIDRYEGQFAKGKPNGKGIYTWANGTYYDGQWRDGMRDGKGKLVYKDSTVVGYWKEDRYQGKNFVAPYAITQNQSVSRYSIRKSNNNIDNGVRIKILQEGVENAQIEGFTLAYSSGSEYRNGNIYGIQNTFLPLDLKITYRSWNQLHTAQFDVVFALTIFDKGIWDVVLTN